MKTFSIDIYTPFGHYLSDKIEFLKLRSEEYTLGILPDHAPLISTVTICEINIVKNGVTEKYATSVGIIKVENNQVNLILNSIESEDEIDLERAEAARQRAEYRLANAQEESINVTRCKIALARAINRINIKKGIK